MVSSITGVSSPIILSERTTPSVSNAAQRNSLRSLEKIDITPQTPTTPSSSITINPINPRSIVSVLTANQSLEKETIQQHLLETEANAELIKTQIFNQKDEANTTLSSLLQEYQQQQDALDTSITTHQTAQENTTDFILEQQHHFSLRLDTLTKANQAFKNALNLVENNTYNHNVITNTIADDGLLETLNLTTLNNNTLLTQDLTKQATTNDLIRQATLNQPLDIRV